MKVFDADGIGAQFPRTPVGALAQNQQPKSSHGRGGGRHGESTLSQIRSQLKGRRILYLSSRCKGADGFSDLADWIGFQLQYCEIADTGITGRLKDEIERADCVLFTKSEIGRKSRGDLERYCRNHRRVLVPLRSASRACFRNAILRLVDESGLPRVGN